MAENIRIILFICRIRILFNWGK